MSAELLDIAVKVAHEAGKLLLEHFRKPAEGVESKSTPTDLVSAADMASEALILDMIAAERPDDASSRRKVGEKRALVCCGSSILSTEPSTSSSGSPRGP